MIQLMQKIVALVVITFVLVTSSSYVFARGGGGGSSSGGSSGGGSSGSGGSRSSSNTKMYKHGNCSSSIEYQTEKECETFGYFLVGGLVSFVVLIRLYPLVARRQKRKHLLETTEPIFTLRTEEVFFQFQKAWSEFDTATLETITSQRFYSQLVLELAVLKNEKRENRMVDIELDYAYVDPKKYNSQEAISAFRVEVRGRAKDSLYDIELQKELYKDSEWFTEYWNFVLDNGVWKLDSIDQATANKASIKKSITDFALRNNFFYNPDFGWLMIPNKGNLFSNASFKTSDINNHVIGVYKNKIVEFYSIEFTQGGDEYFIGQAILPKSYNRIVIERKNKFSLIERTPKGLEKISLESIVFNDEFNVYADRVDAITTFELLHPAYMEYIMGLPYKVNIEVVGNTVYFYTTSKEVDYQKLLEILSRAFDEIKE
jgi:hypothetical protein